jgi:hypothetical protein
VADRAYVPERWSDGSGMVAHLPVGRNVLWRRVPGTSRVVMSPDHRRADAQPPLRAVGLVSPDPQPGRDLLPRCVG